MGKLAFWLLEAGEKGFIHLHFFALGAVILTEGGFLGGKSSLPGLKKRLFAYDSHDAYLVGGKELGLQMDLVPAEISTPKDSDGKNALKS